MKDQSFPSPNERKKFMFWDTQKRQADLRIRLNYDGMSQSQFFRAMITGYLEKDNNILLYLEKHKSENQIQGINKRNATAKLIRDGETTKRQFNLNEEDIEDIFDMIAEEHPEL